ncbi:MAG: glycosyl transferase [Candidatus Rokuibacteriota bacterium]|nr:MAG: glycosyl transferase [Candidatus Rokubacteria bacterium]
MRLSPSTGRSMPWRRSGTACWSRGAARSSGFPHPAEDMTVYRWDEAAPATTGSARRGGVTAERARLLQEIHGRPGGGGLDLARHRNLFRLAVSRLAWRLRADSAPWLKRALDLVGAGLLLIVTAPLLGLVALAIKLEDGGPILFRQVRVGKDGRHFLMYKYRSMVPNAEALKAKLMERNEMRDGVLFKIRNDPRVTRVGRICRRLSLDELPQLLNVLRGDMSLVGPRPPVPSEVARYDPAQRRRLAATPGITCLWQVSGRNDIDFHGQVRLDVQYIERQTLTMDISILLRTVPAALSGKGAS